MKGKLRLLIGLSILACIFKTSISCEAEKEYSNTVNTGYRLRKINFDQLKSRKEVFSMFEKASRVRQNSQMERIVYNEEYDLYFDVDNILFIEKEGYESYTIPLLKEPNDSLVKNLVLYHKLNEPIKAKLMGYKLTDEDIERIRSGEVIDVSNRTYSSVIDPSYTVNGSVSWYDDSGCLVTATTTFVPGTPCIEDGHTFGEPCSVTGSGRATPDRLVIQYTYGFCLDGSVNGGTIGNPTYPTDPGGGGPGDGTSGQTPIENPPLNDEEEDEVVTTPVIPELDAQTTPCVELNKFSSNSGNKNKLNVLKTKTNLTKEYGYTILKNNENNSYQTPEEIQQDPTNPNHLVQIYGDNIVGLMHTHPDPVETGVVPMFSIADLRALVIIALRHNNNGQPKNFSEYTVTMTAQNSNGDKYTYALKIKNFLALMQVFSSESNYKKMKKSLENKYNETTALGAMDDLSLDFLNVLKKNNLQNAVSLYQAEQDFSSWKEIKINPENEFNLIKTPCN